MAAQRWKLERTERRLRAVLEGVTIADTTRALLMIEHPGELVYYFPEADVRTDLLEDAGNVKKSGYRGTAALRNLRVGDRVVENAAWSYPETSDGRPDLRGYIAFEWHKLDAWYEEDEQVFGHPRNPYHRVDAIPSSRHVRVTVDGETVAETSRPTMVFEAGMGARVYIPREDVRMDLLTPTDKQTICPYKGFASYFSLGTNGDTISDVVWTYEEPTLQQGVIKGLVSFWHEKSDRIALVVDGEDYRPTG